MTLIFSLIFLISSAFSTAASDRGYGFTVDLIHRDSPKSPLYNSSETHYYRLAKTLRRSIRHTTVVLADAAEVPLISGGGDYLMKLSLGTPPFSIVAIADTGSDIVWTQCEPCPNCYKQNAPMFNPSKSTTYKKIVCSSPLCSIGGRHSSCAGESCEYSINYGDGSHSHGDQAVDTVTLGSTSGSPISFLQTVIGCGHDNAGSFDAKVSGIVGLGHGPASLVSQMGPAADGKFSYCLAPTGSTELTKLNFGSNADVSGTKTPIYNSDTTKSFYLLNLRAMTVGNNKFDFPTNARLGPGSNIIIDSGSTLTSFPPTFYSSFATAIANSINLKRTTGPNHVLEHCFETTTDDYEVPSITANFEGADLSLHRENVFIRAANNMVCLAFRASQMVDGSSIYGNIAQTNFLIGYDIKNKFVSFKPTNCATM